MQEEITRKHEYDCAYYPRAVVQADSYDTLDDMVAEMFRLRDLRAAYSSWHREQDAVMERDFDNLEASLYARMEAQGLEKLTVAAGTASRSTKVRPTVAPDSWPEVYDFIYDNRRGDLLHKRLTEKVAVELRDNNVIVPGINWAQSVAISLRSKAAKI